MLIDIGLPLGVSSNRRGNLVPSVRSATICTSPVSSFLLMNAARGWRYRTPRAAGAGGRRGSALNQLFVTHEERADQLHHLVFGLLRRRREDKRFLGEDRLRVIAPFHANMVIVLDLIGDELGQVGVEDLLHLQREDRHEEAEEDQADRGDHQAKNQCGNQIDQYPMPAARQAVSSLSALSRPYTIVVANSAATGSE